MVLTLDLPTSAANQADRSAGGVVLELVFDDGAGDTVALRILWHNDGVSVPACCHAVAEFLHSAVEAKHLPALVI